MKNNTKYTDRAGDYIAEEFLKECECRPGSEINWLPENEKEANFCFLESIRKNKDHWNITLRIENEFSGEVYRRTYNADSGAELEMNMLQPNLACFLPPQKISVLVKVLDVSEEHLVLKVVGVDKTARPLVKD